jgi:hypothetical protein
MNLLENCLLLLGLPLGMILTGYWLAVRLTNVSASERFAVAALMGLALLLLNIAVINFFYPLNAISAWLCLWPIIFTLLLRDPRRGLVSDFVTVACNKRGLLAAALATAFLLVLLWPLFSRPSLIFYDGTSNHDGFFWISAAEYLKRHPYMEPPGINQLHPLSNATGAIVGWKPAWGRMGAEGLLAFTSSLIGLASIKLYLAATATLLIPWIAAVFLAVRTFLVGRLGIVSTFALIALQPVFVFFHENSNLPNFVGALMAAAVVIATERSLREETGRGVWLILLGVGLHGLLCSYPEMLPFVVIPGGLLWLRAWISRGPRAAWRPALLTASAWIVGAVINPATTVRAYTGFVASFDTARANQNWANLFDPLSWPEYLPSLATLSVGTGLTLGPVVGGLLSVVILVGIGLAFRRALDRVGALFILGGSMALLAYTLYTGFNYGWQKTVQFGGAFWAAWLPVAIIDAFAVAKSPSPAARWLQRASLVGLVAFFGLATFLNCFDGHKWSHRKIITQDWFTVRDFSRRSLSNAPVLVDGSTFRMAFFHGMWAAYFLPDNELYFAARGKENGGYLRDSVANEARTRVPPPAAFLVSRDWADTFDRNSERLVDGDTVTLLKKSNRVLEMNGLQPENGPPENAEASFDLTIVPHSKSQLQFTLLARPKIGDDARHWKIVRQIGRGAPSTTELNGPPPWLISIPLQPGEPNHLSFSAEPVPPEQSMPPFMIHDIRVQPVVE